jgi:hypothetical protein
MLLSFYCFSIKILVAAACKEIICDFAICDGSVNVTLATKIEVKSLNVPKIKNCKMVAINVQHKLP